MKKQIILVISLSIFFTVVYAQDSTRISKAQEAMRTLGAGPEHEILKSIQGKWRFVATLTGPRGKAAEIFAGKGTTVNKMVLEDRFVLSESAKQDKKPLGIGVAILGYDRGNKKYTVQLYSEGGTYAASSAGDYDPERNLIHTEGSFYNPVLDVTEVYDIDIAFISRTNYRVTIGFKDSSTRSTMGALIVDYTRNETRK